MIDIEINNMKKLTKLESVIHVGVKDLKKLYKVVESYVRSLNGLEINYQYFGPLSIPIVLEKQPNTIKLEISSKLEKENWNIGQVLLVIHEEISARESFEYLQQNDSDRKELNNHSTASSLNAQIKAKNLFFEKVKIITGTNIKFEPM